MRGGGFIFKQIIYSAPSCLLIQDGDLIVLQFIQTGYLALFPNASSEEIEKIINWLEHFN